MEDKPLIWFRDSFALFARRTCSLVHTQ